MPVADTRETRGDLDLRARVAIGAWPRENAIPGARSGASRRIRFPTNGTYRIRDSKMENGLVLSLLFNLRHPVAAGCVTLRETVRHPRRLRKVTGGPISGDKRPVCWHSLKSARTPDRSLALELLPARSAYLGAVCSRYMSAI